MQISVQNLGMSYPGKKDALKDINLEMQSPNMLGLVGPNGAGKSTLIKLLVAGLLQTSGSILLDGKPLTEQEKKLKSMLGYLPQSFGLYDELTVYQFLDYICALKGIKNSREAIETIISQTNLQEKKNARIGTLSGGQRQRVGIAQALIGNPEFIILDEPTVGLDPEERINFRNLFSRTSQNKLVLLSTHIIEDVQSICSRLIALHKGQILFDGPPEELIIPAQGHVGTFLEQDGKSIADGLCITSRINTAKGVSCRIVAQTLPDFAAPAEPTLEDAYMYLLNTKGAKS